MEQFCRGGSMGVTHLRSKGIIYQFLIANGTGFGTLTFSPLEVVTRSLMKTIFKSVDSDALYL